jgi:hypothetical protein
VKAAKPNAKTGRKDASRSGWLEDLRARTEKLARGKAVAPHKPRGAASQEETLRLLHELQVHQIELEMQNEDLRDARASAEPG